MLKVTYRYRHFSRRTRDWLRLWSSMLLLWILETSDSALVHHMKSHGVSLVVRYWDLTYRDCRASRASKKLDAVIDGLMRHKDHTAGPRWYYEPFNFRQKKDMACVWLSRNGSLNKAQAQFAHLLGHRTPGIPTGSTDRNRPIRKFRNRRVRIPLLFLWCIYKASCALEFRIKDFTYITDANYICWGILAFWLRGGGAEYLILWYWMLCQRKRIFPISPSGQLWPMAQKIRGSKNLLHPQFSSLKIFTRKVENELQMELHLAMIIM